jgi:hypothetical protein
MQEFQIHKKTQGKQPQPIISSVKDVVFVSKPFLKEA